MPEFPSPNTSPSRLPSAEVRGWVSFLLFIHLFAVVVGLVAYTFPSPLEARLAEVFAPYLTTLNFDPNANAYPTGRFYLTHAMPDDVDFVVEVEGTLPDGSTRTTQVPLPNIWPGERRRHYQALANVTGRLSQDENRESLLARAIAGPILLDWQARKGIVRVKGHLLIEMAALASTDPEVRDPYNARYYNTAYQAHVLVSSNGTVDLVKISPAFEVAPVEKEPIK